MSVSDFWDSELRDVFNVVNGYNRREEHLMRERWERTRWQTAVMLSPHAKKNKPIKVTDLLEFPWEKKDKRKFKVKLTPEEIAAKFAKLDRHMRRQAKQANGES